jgi:hypothetical protein
MRRSLPILLTVLALLATTFLYAQTTNSNTQPDDDVPFLGIMALALVAMMTAGFIAGFLGMCLLLAGILALVMVGILSSSLLVGIYKRSFTAGFKTFLLLACGIFGALSGLCGFYLINSIFELHISGPIVAATGSLGGALGGIILALSMVGVLRLFLAFAARRLSLKIS